MSARKPTDQRQRGKRTKDVGDSGSKVVALVAGAGLCPDADEDWAASTSSEWAEYWASDVGRIAAVTDVPAVRRLFDYRDLSAKLSASYKDLPFVAGSMGQIKTNPALGDMLKLAPTIAALELQFGCTPKARLGLGLDVANVATRLDQINAAFDQDDDEDDADVIALLEAK